MGSLIVNEKSLVGTFFEEPKLIFIRLLIVNGKRNHDFKNSKMQKRKIEYSYLCYLKFRRFGTFFEKSKSIFIHPLIVNEKRNPDFKNSKVQKE